jgi:Na+-transporting NADH:ubiquinone oxidoreductase subunit NqrD
MEKYLPFVAPVLTVLWLLICLRIYTMISRRNVVQRRVVAIGAGLGAGLVYVVSNLLVSIVRLPEPESDEERVRVQMKAASKD